MLQEVAILSRVENATEALLARCFENYYSLQENAPNGLLDGGVAAAEQPAPALQPAVELCNILRDVLKPGDQQWLTDRFKVAAKRRYHRLLDGADATISRGRRPWLVLSHAKDPTEHICMHVECPEDPSGGQQIILIVMQLHPSKILLHD